MTRNRVRAVAKEAPCWGGFIAGNKVDREGSGSRYRPKRDGKKLARGGSKSSGAAGGRANRSGKERAAGSEVSLRITSIIDFEFQPTNASASSISALGNLSWPRGAIAITGLLKSLAESISECIQPACATYIPASTSTQSAFLIFASNWCTMLRNDLGRSSDHGGRGRSRVTLIFSHLKLLSAFRSLTAP